MKTIKIILQKDEEMTVAFLDAFTKIVINTNQYIYLSQLYEYDTLKYSKFYDFILNSPSFKHNGPKSPICKISQDLNFEFISKKNNITMLLDLSSYMLIYNYGTKSFPLKNMQKITRFLLNNLVQKYIKDRSYQYRLTIYLFSIYRQNLELLIFNEKLTQTNIQLLTEFINKTIEKSKIPYEKSLRKENIQQKIQKLFDYQESYIGMKCLIVISSFHEEEISEYYLFTPNWYVYGLINIGGHYGSYIIDNQSIQNRLMIGKYLKTKYVFKAKFLENWEMTDIKKKENPLRTEPVTGKFRSIIFENNGKTYQQIFDLLLKYKIVLKDSKKKVIIGEESVISTIKQNASRMLYKRQYKIPADNFSYILRTKYAQGWEPIMMNYSTFIQSSKFKLRLNIHQNNYIYYQARRNKNDFIVTIFNPSAQKAKNENTINKHENDRLQFAKELINNIEKLDTINSYNFISFMNENWKIKNLRNNFMRNNEMFDHNRSYQIMNDLSTNIQEWGKYFKLKRIYFQFEPTFSKTYLDELINEISYILGKKINNLIFVKQIQGDRKYSQNIDNMESCIRKVMFTKINTFGDIIELQLAFMKYTFVEIENIIESLTNKIKSSKFKWGFINEVSYELVFFLKYTHDINNMFFNHQWILKFKSKYYKNLFKIFWEQILKSKLIKSIPFKNQASVLNYYKTLEMKAENNLKIQKIIFLKVKESEEKDNEMNFHCFMCPSLIQAFPFFKEYSQKSKFVNMQQIVTLYAKELKRTQANILKLLDTYQIIHCRLIDSLSTARPKLMNKPLQKLNNELYDIKKDNKGCNFKSSMAAHCRQISNKYYRQLNTEKLSTIPFPTKFLMTTQLQQIQGDIDLEIDGKMYSFFFCTPYKIIYLYKQSQQIFYKMINMYFQEFNFKETENDYIDLFLKEIKYNINEQIYGKDFKIFLDGNYKFGIAKIINNQFFTHNQQKIIEINTLYKYVPQDLAQMEHNQIIYTRRLNKLIDLFCLKLFILIEEFFPLLRVNYYFQIRKQQKDIPFGIDGSISRVDSQLFMRLVYVSNHTETDVTTSDMLLKLIMLNKSCLNSLKDHLKFRFYLKKKNNSQRSFIFINYFTDYIQKLITEISYKIETIYITNIDQLYEFAFKQQDPSIEKVQLEVIKKQSQNEENLSKFIQTKIMKHYLPFKKISMNASNPEFMIVEEQNGLITIKQNLVMKIQNGILEFVFRLAIFFVDEQMKLKDKVQQYLQKLKNFINASILVKQLVENQDLPLEPYELWLNESVNSLSNKILNEKKKKRVKNPVTKYYKKTSISQTLTEKTNINTLESSKLVYLNMIYRSYMPLNDRIAKNVSLDSIKSDQIFSMNQILNLKNTYLFLEYFEKNHMIFHFEQVYDEAMIKQISSQNGEQIYHKSKKYLVYYVFCLNPLVTKDNIQKKISYHIKLNLRKNQFDEVSNHLLKNNEFIENYEQYFIRGSAHDKQKSKEYRFQLPHYMDKDQLAYILIQHIERYHYRVKFRSQLDKSKDKVDVPTSNNKFLQSIRFIETSKSQISSREELEIAKKLHKRPSVNVDSTRNLFLSTNFSRFRNSEMSSMNLTETVAYNKHPQLSFYEPQSYSMLTEYIQFNWLFNWVENNGRFSHKFGKCLYFLKMKKEESSNKQTQRICTNFNQNMYLFSRNEYETLEMKKLLLMTKRNILKIFKKDSYLKNSLILQITDHAGTIQLGEINQNFYLILKSSMAEYYIEKYLYMSFLEMITSNEKGQVDESGESKKTKQDQVYKLSVHLQLLEWSRQLDTIIENISSLGFSKYKSSNVLFKNKNIYFVDFFHQFVKIINYYHASEDLPILIYFELQNQQYSFLTTYISNTNRILEQVQAMSSKEVINMGFIITDYLLDLNLHYDNKFLVKSSTSNTKLFNDLGFLKMFKDIPFKEDYKFKRSLLIYYEINQTQFLYGSYNLSHDVDNDIKQYCKSMECWLKQKMKVYKFIKNIKENNRYEIEKAKDKFRKIDSFLEIVFNKNDSEKQTHYQQNTNKYTLLLDIIFKDFPEQILKEEKGQAKPGQAKEKMALQSNRVKYYHHCKQTQKLLHILKNNGVNYSKYASYKGNQKFLLQKIGREYVSLLRQQYKAK